MGRTFGPFWFRTAVEDVQHLCFLPGVTQVSQRSNGTSHLKVVALTGKSQSTEKTLMRESRRRRERQPGAKINQEVKKAGPKEAHLDDEQASARHRLNRQEFVFLVYLSHRAANTQGHMVTAL